MDSSVIVKLCRQLQSLAKLFRFVELCILLTFISWLSTRLPFAVKISGEYFCKLISLIFCPISIFLLGNAIVLTLLTKSGLFSGQSPPSIDNAVAEFYEEFRSENHDEATPLPLKEEVVFQDKEIICEENTVTTSSKVKIEENNNEEEIVVFPEEIKRQEAVEKATVSYRRSKSENKSSNEEKKEKFNEKLRRSETDIYWRSQLSGEEESGVNDENMSNEEFRRTIEAFIAKQVRFHREERLSVVLHGQA